MRRKYGIVCTALGAENEALGAPMAVWIAARASPKELENSFILCSLCSDVEVEL
jgi:hypothetical protein